MPPLPAPDPENGRSRGAAPLHGTASLHGTAPQNPLLAEKTLSAQTVYTGSFFSIDQELVELPNGSTSSREILHHPGAVAIVALTADGKVVLERQFRASVKQELLEIPAGKMEPGEDPGLAARRELLEETGYEAAHWERVAELLPAPGYSDQVLHLFFATGLTQHAAKPDADEFIELAYWELEALVQAIAAGRIVDAKTAAAVLIYAARHGTIQVG